MAEEKSRRKLTKKCMQCGIEMAYDEDCQCLLDNEKRSHEKRERKRDVSRKQNRKQKQQERWFDND